MSEEIGGEIVPDSTRELEIDNEVDLMIEDLDLWYGNKQALYGVSPQLRRTVLLHSLDHLDAVRVPCFKPLTA